jgi:hypothetical protein
MNGAALFFCIFQQDLYRKLTPNWEQKGQVLQKQFVYNLQLNFGVFSWYY